ncbi:MAG TPA: LuxR C-terminal-related transcriptional regulator [Geothrix sp.]|nr:LuxR C-terminal-related transcriptional regulator [Geothrix sp.]
MTHISGIIRQRATPGVLILDLEGRLVFSNDRAMDLLATISPAEADPRELPAPVREVFQQVRQHGGEATLTLRFPAPDHSGMNGGVMPPCSLRAFPLGIPGSDAASNHIMVLMDRIVEKHQLDIEKARATFQLSKREAEVLNLIGLGFTNKKIAESLYLSEHTVKDHIKNLMKKLGTTSRGEVVATLR